MTLLATNKATKRSKFDNVLEIFFASFFGVPSILLFYLSWQIYQETNSFSFDLFFLVVGALITLYMALLIIDNCLRWTLGVESVKVDNGILVIDCKGSILRRHKEIPLSKIRKVKQFGNIGITWGVDAPDRLKVIYSGIRRYRFGMCMNSYERDTLAKIIMALAEGSKRREEAGKRDDPMK